MSGAQPEDDPPAKRQRPEEEEEEDVSKRQRVISSVPAKNDTATIVDLIEQREKARSAKDWGVADDLRETLISLGVELLDKERVWRSKLDGRTGSYEPGSEVRQVVKLDREKVIQLLVERSAARKLHDWSTADRLRDELRMSGIEVIDKERLWKGPDGAIGLIPHATEETQAAAVPEGAIYQILEAREALRRKKNFTEADQLRTDLKEQGIELFDKDKVWRDVKNGRQGPLPGAGPRPMPGMSNVPGMPPMPHPTMPMPYGGAQSLQPQGHYSSYSYGVTGGPGMPPAPMPSYGMPPQPHPPREAYGHGVSAPMHRDALNATGDSPTDGEIAAQVAQREMMRANKEYGPADAVRSALRSRGVDLNDKERRWTCKDGRSGAIPNFAEAQALVGQARSAAPTGYGGPPAGIPPYQPPQPYQPSHAAYPPYQQ